MSQKIPIQLGSVQKTLLLPLWGRAVESKKKRPLLVDKTAVQIIDSIDYDFSRITENMNPLSQLSWVVRCLHIDRFIQPFLQKDPYATVIDIGCGLDTTFERVDNGKLRWYDLDLPDVITLRKNFILEHERRKFIAASFLDEGWLRQVRVDNTVMVLAAGVFYYFEEDRIRSFFKRLVNVFPKGEIVFDSASQFGIKVANKKVIRDGGMDETSILKWGLDDSDELHQWDGRLNVVDAFPMFHGIKRKLSIRGKVGTFISDMLGVMSMVHLRFPTP